MQPKGNSVLGASGAGSVCSSLLQEDDGMAESTGDIANARKESSVTTGRT